MLTMYNNIFNEQLTMCGRADALWWRTQLLFAHSLLMIYKITTSVNHDVIKRAKLKNAASHRHSCWHTNSQRKFSIHTLAAAGYATNDSRMAFEFPELLGSTAKKCD